MEFKRNETQQFLLRQRDIIYFLQKKKFFFDATRTKMSDFS